MKPTRNVIPIYIKMTTIQHLNWRYATKKFDNTKALDQEQIDALIEAFNLTATSYGLQPIKLFIIENKETRQNLLEHSFNQQQVVDASHLLVIAAKTVMTQEDINSFFERIKEIRSTPEDITAPYKAHLTNWVSETSSENMELWARKQTYIALGNLLSTCALMQIDSCPMEGFDASAYDKVLGLDQTEYRASLVLPVGYRHEEDFMANLPKIRKETSEIVSFI